MKKIYTSNNRVLMQLLKSKLAGHDIQSFIKNENPPLAGEIPPDIAPPELWVIDGEKYPEALQIIEQTLADSLATKKHWRCPSCQEYLEGQFDICWHCGASRKEK